MNTAHTYKIALLGEARTGKTSLVRRHLSGNFDSAYRATVGVLVNPLLFSTTHGPVHFNVWDLAGVDALAGRRADYLVATQGAIVVFDLTRRDTFTALTEWLALLPPGIPAVLCGNKADCKNRSVTLEDLYPHLHAHKYFETSARSCYNFEKPFLELARALVDPFVALIERPPVTPPEASPLGGIPEERVYVLPPRSDYEDFSKPVKDFLEPRLEAAGASRKLVRVTVRVEVFEAG